MICFLLNKKSLTFAVLPAGWGVDQLVLLDLTDTVEHLPTPESRHPFLATASFLAAWLSSQRPPARRK